MILLLVDFWCLRSVRPYCCRGRQRVSAGSVPSFAAGTGLWTALLLVSVPRVLAIVARVLGLTSAVFFAILAARIFWGEQLLPTSAPLPFYAYPFLVMTLISWIWSPLRECTC
jgi:hypothetical protein